MKINYFFIQEDLKKKKETCLCCFSSLCLLVSLCHVLWADGSTPPSSVHSRTLINNCTTSYRERNAYACWSICRQPHNINTGTKNRQDEDFFPCVRGKRFSSIFIRKPGGCLVSDGALLLSFFCYMCYRKRPSLSWR